MWKKFYVEIKYLKLDFRFSSCSSFSSLGPFFFSIFIGSSSAGSFLFCAWVLCVLPWVSFFFVFFLFSWGLFFFFLYGSLHLLFFFNLRSSSFFFRFFFLFYVRLEFHVAKTCPCQQLELETLRLNFFTELEPQRLEMLFSSVLFNAC